MTSVPFDNVSAQFREAGRYAALAVRFVLFAVAWTLAKTCRLIATVLGALLFGVGWLAGRVAWPALRWSGDVVKLGWQQGCKPMSPPSAS